ncbi:MBL fold metallo-hydrolase [Pseudomonas luteola]|uniref:MBL fold metallo-hydrolase n=1 Tax=Pseudomonas luteola TaxID=47886 RepID=UPI00388E16A8
MKLITQANWNVSVEYRFHPVGQGLFASGRIDYVDIESAWLPPSFSWVYDCGTSSRAKQYLLPELDHLLARQGGVRGKLDLLVLSHFDKDHINGVIELLERFQVDTLLLPLVPLWKRLELVFDENIKLSSPLIEFYLSPINYLLSRYPERVLHVVLVPATSVDNGESGESYSERRSGSLSGDFIPEPDEAQAEELTAINKAYHSRVKFLKPGSSLSIGRVWEFLPYNDMDLQLIPPDWFLREVNLARSKLTSHASRRVKESVLKRLKLMYYLLLGNSALARNKISLFLYCGPVTSNKGIIEAVVPSTFVRLADGETKANINLRFSHSAEGRLGILYTGDGYMSNSRHVYNLKNYLGPRRWAQISCLQVPHHGARSNWCKGHATLFSPDLAVFCSDPKRKNTGHPHREVVADFAGRTVVQVDKKNGFVIEGKLQLTEPGPDHSTL